jgi:hypothetical protein
VDTPGSKIAPRLEKSISSLAHAQLVRKTLFANVHLQILVHELPV